jgi:hypothetical protein
MTTRTLSTIVPDDAPLLDVLEQSIAATGPTYPNQEGRQVPYILARREVRNGSGRVVGHEVDVSAETYAGLLYGLEVARADDEAAGR